MMNKLHSEVDQKDPRVLKIYWEGELFRTVTKFLFIRELNKLRFCEEKDDFLKKFQEVEVQAARKEVVRLLSKKSYFTEELRKKLLQRGICESIVELTLLYCEEKGFVDDSSRTERLIMSEFQKGHGSQYIYFKLKQKKIPSSEVAKFRAFIATEEKRSLQNFLKKGRKKVKEGHQLIAQLLRRGYSYESVQSVLGGDL